MAARGHFVFPIHAKNHKVLVIWDLNGYGEYEFDWCICDKVIIWPEQALACGAAQPKHNTPEIFKFRGYNNNNRSELESYSGPYNTVRDTFRVKMVIGYFLLRVMG